MQSLGHASSASWEFPHHGNPVFHCTKKEPPAGTGEWPAANTMSNHRHASDKGEQPCNKNNLPYSKLLPGNPALIIQMFMNFIKHSALNPLQVSLLLNTELIFHYPWKCAILIRPNLISLLTSTVIFLWETLPERKIHCSRHFSITNNQTQDFSGDHSV